MACVSYLKLLGCALLFIQSFAISLTDVIERDVLVIGGGSTGIYSAVRLQDLGKSVVVVERKGVTGGHAETYIDPITGTKLNLGVVVFANSSYVRDYLSRLKVSTTLFSTVSDKSTYVNFLTGQKAESYRPPSDADFAAAVQKYIQLLDGYESIRLGFNLSYPVAKDLVLPFGDFVRKFGLDDLIATSFTYFQGYTPLLKIPTLYVLKYMNALQLNSLFNGFLTTASHDTHQIYDNAAKILSPHIIYNASIHSMNRSTMEIVVRTPNGHRTIRAKKILSTIPPKLENLSGFDLCKEERSLFKQFFSNGYYSGVIKNSGVPEANTFQAVDLSQPFDIPNLGGIYSLSQIPNTDLTQFFFSHPTPLSATTVKNEILAALHRITDIDSSKAEIVTFTDHSPFNMMVSPHAIKKGFYRDLLELQGRRNTFYAGAAWHTQDSSNIWHQLEEVILPALLREL